MELIDKSELNKLISKKKLEKFQDDLEVEIQEAVEATVNEKLKQYANKNRVIKNDDQKEHISAKKVLSKEQIAKLPKWVREDIDNASIVGNSKQVIQVSNGRKYHLLNRLNDLPGAEWTYFLNSVISTRYGTSGIDSYAHHIRKIHPSPKPPQLMEDIIKFFTKENEIVLDYFMGVGGTLLGASLCNRRAIGIDLEKQYIDAYKEANKFLELAEQKTIIGDSIKILSNPAKILKEIGAEKISLILIDPPYGDMMSREKTGEAVKKKKDTSATPFTDLDTDLGNMDWKTFRLFFEKSILDASLLLKNKGHIVIFIKDMQPAKGKTNLLHADLINDMNNIDGIKYLGTKIWADLGVNLYPYGYPFSYVSNQIHQYILIFQKEVAE